METPKPKLTLSDITKHYPVLEIIVPELTSKELYALARSSKQNWMNVMAKPTSARNLMLKTTCDGEGVKWKLTVTGMLDIVGAHNVANLGHLGCQTQSNKLCELCGFKVCKECKFSDDDDVEGFHFQAQDGLIFNGKPVTGTIRHSDIMNKVACEVKDCACGAQARDEKLHQYCAQCHRLVLPTVYEKRNNPPLDRAATVSRLAQLYPGANVLIM
ncbi:uncharacterized protein K452DRAFT_297328 [Aplosporella prunicola CBS 121167]|uniref:Uncharacterized protein n=1 Tax=Aplosporella prunicola CBS 121167 TaxID=1176127 RepID=A0A6A6BHI5_9PEZI|nr:uncharacterized protein K452DRAFT_297328 [Aplosporella prunicola CBS 121167]KAF2142795.1 hypothetical protein K452DRAFT_297328 [Aplosporella prunicola CBS 121167]